VIIFHLGERAVKTKTVSVAELGHGHASRTIRDAQNGPVLVSKENRPAAWIVSAERLAELAVAHGAESASIYQQTLELLAIEQYRQGTLTLGQAAKLANIPLSDFIDLCGRLHVPVLWPSSDGLEADLAGAAELADKPRQRT
jgi:PHD/YefM family antitoxin component YafN of YafNO toxin-antitoxin module